MRILLIVCAVLTSACATTTAPEVGRALRDYPAAEFEPAAAPIALEAAPASGITEVDGKPVIYYTKADFGALERFVEAARANTRALLERNAAWAARERELAHLLAAGRAAEELAEVYRELYLSEANHARLTKLAAGGAAGLLLVILTAGTL